MAELYELPTTTPIEEKAKYPERPSTKGSWDDIEGLQIILKGRPNQTVRIDLSVSTVRNTKSDCTAHLGIFISDKLMNHVAVDARQDTNFTLAVSHNHTFREEGVFVIEGKWLTDRGEIWASSNDQTILSVHSIS